MGSYRGTGSSRGRGRVVGPDVRPQADLGHAQPGGKEGVSGLVGVKVGMGNDRGTGRCYDDRRSIHIARGIRDVHILGNTSRLIFLQRREKQNIMFHLFLVKCGIINSHSKL